MSRKLLFGKQELFSSVAAYDSLFHFLSEVINLLYNNPINARALIVQSAIPGLLCQ